MFAFGEYDAASRTLPLSWGAGEGALGYEVEYRDSSDDGATWRRYWTLAQKTTATDRTATAVYANYRYEFRVRAFGAGGAVSDWTAISFAASEVNIENKEDRETSALAAALLDAFFASDEERGGVWGTDLF